MNAGRNDPCPCGSGKKFKNCCLSKDQEKRPEQFEARTRQLVAAAANREPDLPRPSFTPLPPPKSPPPAPPDPRMEAINARWEEFEDADFDGQLALFLATLEEPELMDDELASGMIDRLYLQFIARDERERLDGLVESLRERLPNVYATRQKYYLSCQFTNAMASQQPDAARRFAKEMAEMEDGDIDQFDKMLNQLAYHGQLATLVEVMRIAWPRVKNTWDVVPWGVNSFAVRLSNHAVFEHLERNPLLAADEPGLVEEVQAYVDFQPDKFALFLDNLTGRDRQAWTMDDFRFEVAVRSRGDRRGRDDEPHVLPNAATENLATLMDEFIVYLHCEEQISFPKAELAREQLHQYILDRLTGQLRERRSMMERMMNPQPFRREPPPKPPEHALCPDRATLDRFLAQRLDFLAPQYHRVAATFELVPAWLRFLERYSLIDSARRTKTLDDLKELHGHLRKLCDQLHEYPALKEGLENWPQ